MADKGLDLTTILSVIAAVLTIVPVAVRLFVTPVIKRLMEDMSDRMQRKLTGKLRAQEILFRGLLKEHEDTHHGGRRREQRHYRF